jgi:penicillin-binding protein 2
VRSVPKILNQLYYESAFTTKHPIATALKVEYNATSMTDYQVKLRLIIFRVLVALTFTFLAFQTWRLQVGQGEEYRLLADQNRFRTVTLDAPRGVIYDRNGVQLVRNRPTFNVTIIPAFLPDDETARTRLFARLAELLAMPITTVRGPGDAMALREPGPFRASRSGAPWERQSGDGLGGPGATTPKGIRDMVDAVSVLAPYQPIVIQKDVDPAAVALLEEESLHLPGVLIETAPARDYLTGALTSQVLGYTGAIPEAQVDDFKAKGYGPNDRVGLTGLELQYEDLVHGIKGTENVEVDVNGRKVRTVGEPTPAQPGHNLKLTLDVDLQQVATDALAKGIKNTPRQAGVVIVLDPRSGQILAMVSLPAYDNNLFAGGISVGDYITLSRDKSRPLVNHAIAGLYPPGSIYKIIPASGALQDGVVTPHTVIVDPGVIWLPNKYFPDDPKLAQPFYCWNRQGHGQVSLVYALAESCDVYFYEVSGGYEPTGFKGLGEERLAYYAELFGLGTPTGIDLPGELAGLVPTPKWKRLNYAETWVTGDTYNMGIGQGFNLVTPLQILNATAAVANGGTLYRPYLVQEVLDAEGKVVTRQQPEVIRDLRDTIDPENLALVQQGLETVVAGGTGAELDVPGVQVAGKTGTAEFCDSYPSCIDRDGRVRTSHAWFTAYAPAKDPQVAVVVFVYGGGEGSQVALPIAGDILRYYFGVGPKEEPTPAAPAVAKPPALKTPFIARLLGTDGWGGGGAAVTGFVLDKAGLPLPGLTINVWADTESTPAAQPVAQITSGPTGQFDFNEVDTARTSHWRLELVGYPSAQALSIDAETGYRYIVEFQSGEPVK